MSLRCHFYQVHSLSLNAQLGKFCQQEFHESFQVLPGNSHLAHADYFSPQSGTELNKERSLYRPSRSVMLRPRAPCVPVSESRWDLGVTPGGGSRSRPKGGSDEKNQGETWGSDSWEVQRKRVRTCTGPEPPVGGGRSHTGWVTDPGPERSSQTWTFMSLGATPNVHSSPGGTRPASPSEGVT